MPGPVWGRFSANWNLFYLATNERRKYREDEHWQREAMLMSHSNTVLHFQNKPHDFFCFVFSPTDWTTSFELVPQTPHASLRSKSFSRQIPTVNSGVLVFFLIWDFFDGPTTGVFLYLVRFCSSFTGGCRANWRLCSVTCLCFGSGRRSIHPNRVAASADEGNIPDNVECEQSAGHCWYKKTWHNESDPEVYQMGAVLSK